MTRVARVWAEAQNPSVCSASGGKTLASPAFVLRTGRLKPGQLAFRAAQSVCKGLSKRREQGEARARPAGAEETGKPADGEARSQQPNGDAGDSRTSASASGPSKDGN